MNSTITAAPVLSPERLAGAHSYNSYRGLIEELMAVGKTTGPTQSEDLTDYARLNIQRMERLDKKTELLPDLLQTLDGLAGRYEWLIITEGWCGDAAQIVPVLEKIAQASNGRINTRYFLRDENPDLMDRYLTNGARSIPRLVVLHADTLVELTSWGPRPVLAQELFFSLKASGATHAEYAEQVHAWYAKNRTLATQEEILTLIQQLPG